MTPEEKCALVEAKKMINRFKERHLLKDGDFDEEGEITIEAAVRVMSTLQRLLSEKAFRTFEKYMWINGLMSELAAIGALKRVPSKAGMPTYTKVRDWSEAEGNRASARLEARLQMRVQ